MIGFLAGRARLLMAGVLLAVAFVSRPAEAIQIDRVVSPGGIEAWLVQDHTVPVIAMEFSFEGGTATDPAGKEGLANLASTLLDEGAGPYDSQAFQKRLQDEAISLSFTATADAFFGSIKMLDETRDLAADMLRVALTEPRFEEEAVERMRRAVLSQIRRDLGDPDFIARRTFYDAAYPGHPYGRRSKGTLETVQALAQEDLRGFVKRRFARDTLTVGVTGAISPAELGPLLDTIFGGLPVKAEPIAIPDAKPKGQGETIVVRRPIGQSIVLLGQEGIKREDPDWFPATIMNYVLGGGGFGARLMEEIREKRGLSYGVYSYLVPFEHTALVMGGGSTANPNAGTMIDLIRAEWARMAEQGVTPEELENAKTYLTGSFPLQLTSTDSVAEVLLQVQRDELGIDYLDRRNNLIRAVTAEDVKRVAKRLLDPARLLTVVVGQPEGVAATKVLDGDRS